MIARSLLLSLVLSPLVVAGCGGGSHHEPEEYTGCGTDEHFQTFEDNEAMATVSDTTGPKLTAPAAGATVPFAQKPILTWNQDSNDPGMASGDVPYMGPGCNDCCPQFNIGALTTLHEPAISGTVYDLQFYVGTSYLHRVVTTLQEWTPTDDFWQTLKGKTVTVKIYRVSLLVNELKQGPFIAATANTFTVGS